MWSCDYDATLETLKENTENAPIIDYPKWNKEFDTHFGVSGTSLYAIFAQPREQNCIPCSYVDTIKYFVNHSTTLMRKWLHRLDM